MRLAVVAALSLSALAKVAHAEPLPPGSLGLVFGGMSGTGADASRIGFGYYAPLYPPSFSAAWQPMSTEQRIGWAVRWTTLFGDHYEASAARITEDLLTLQMDLTIGVRIRPGIDPSRYITLRGGAELFRANQQIPPKNERAFFGPVASIGLEQYAWGILFDADVQYGMITNGPSEIALIFGVSITGP
jgi:hypothetical protein